MVGGYINEVLLPCLVVLLVKPAFSFDAAFTILFEIDPNQNTFNCTEQENSSVIFHYVD